MASKTKSKSAGSGASIKTAMVLAAGLGERMRPLTDNCPKPLIEVCGATMLDRVLDHLKDAGVTRAVVNHHYLGDMIRAHLAERTAPEIEFSSEDDARLETGGGVTRALPKLGDKPFIVANSDTIWLDGPSRAIDRLRAAWNPKRMDALLMLFPTVAAFGYDGPGDYFMDPTGRLTRRTDSRIAPFVFTGVQILHPRLFKDAPEGRFSLVTLYDNAQENDRLFGMRHDGEWYHVGTPQALEEVEDVLRTPHHARKDWL